MNATIRAELRDRLRSLLPDRYVLRANATPLETIQKPTLQIKQLAIKPAPEAGIGQLVVEMTLTLASPLTNPQRAEDQLDDDVIETLAKLDVIEWLDWQRAEKRVTGADNQYLAYDIECEVRTTTPEGE